jgi:CheY-like chemotaxis protein
MHQLAPPAKVLLVDDLPSNLLVLEAVLAGVEYTLLKAHSGPEALALLKQHSDITLILLDVQMPGMDGFEVSRRIKAHDEFRDIPIIFVTAVYHEDPFVKKGYQAGAVDYFSKPFDPEILKLKVGIYASFRQRAHLLKERERQIKESEELLRTGRKLAAIWKSLPIGVIIVDPQGRVCQTNEEVLRILKSVEQTESDSYGEFMAWWERDGYQLRSQDGLLMRALSGEHTSHNEIVGIKCLDGTSKSVFTSASPLRGPDQNIIGAVVVLQDVTAHRKIEADIEERISTLVPWGVEVEKVAPGGKPRGAA